MATQNAKAKKSVKRELVDKANRRIVVLTGIAGFMLVFTLVTANTLVKQASYQNRVIDTRKKALSVAESNVQNVDQLRNQYQAFTGTPQNVIGGNSAMSGDGNGNNSQIVLNALPSRYDFPALTASLEYLAQRNGLKLTAITATDDEATQQSNVASSTPVPVEMPFSMSVTGSLQGIQALVNDFQRSIRPFQIQTLSYTQNGEGGWSAEIAAKTFFQPAKDLNVREEPVQ